MCHYCGYTIRQPKTCPSCGSPYIAPFGTGTQKIEEMATKMFPKARILRMDLDTTSKRAVISRSYLLLQEEKQISSLAPR